MSTKEDDNSPSTSRSNKGVRRQSGKAGLAAGLVAGTAIFQKPERYGSLHDALFHYVQEDWALAVESAKL